MSPMEYCMLSHFSCVLLCVILWTVACQAALSMRFSRQEYWSGFPFPIPGDLPNPGIKPGSPALHADTLPSEPPGKPKIVYRLTESEKRSRSIVSDSLRPRTVAHQVPLSMGFPRQEYWSGLPFPSSEDFPDPGIEPRSLALWADALLSETLAYDNFHQYLSHSHSI